MVSAALTMMRKLPSTVFEYGAVMRSLPIVPLAIALLAAVPARSIEPVPADAAAQHWECVPVARSLSGIQIRGNALTWWDQADGRYQRGHQPKRGAVLAFKPYGAMTLGHVAAVSRIIDDRTLLVTHSNWSRIDGRRGQIERDVRVIDVSQDNDWSQVRVWFAPLGDVGTTAWPTHGFIYPQGKPPMRLPEGAAITGGSVHPVQTAGAPVKPLSSSRAAPRSILPADRFITETRDVIAERPAEPRPTGKLSYLEKKLAQYK